LITAAAVENIMNKITTKDNIWSVNTGEEYLKKMTDAPPDRNRDQKRSSNCFAPRRTAVEKRVEKNFKK